MKISGAKKVHYDSGPNMTPLVDVVMVILIFLMLAGSFGSGEHYMVSSAAVHDKGVQSEKAADPNYVPPVLIEVQVNREGGVHIPGRTTAITEDKALVEALSGLLERLVTENHRPAKEIELVLRPAGDTEWEHLAPVYDAGLRAKFEKIGFAASH